MCARVPFLSRRPLSLTCALGPFFDGPQKKRIPKGDVNDTWKHDMYNQDARSLSARLTNAPAGAPTASVAGGEQYTEDNTRKAVGKLPH